MQLFNEEFTTPGDLSLYIFSSITFKIGDNISEYKKKKKKDRKSWQISFKTRVRKVNSWVTNEFGIVIVNSPKTTTEQRNLVPGSVVETVQHGSER